MDAIPLPEPDHDLDTRLMSALRDRHSVRDFQASALSLEDVAAILWATQGLNTEDGGRTAPSAGALYPLEVFLVAGRVDGLEVGVYRYRPLDHDLLRHSKGDRRSRVAEAALKQEWIADAPALLVIAAVFKRTTAKYDQRGRRYVHMEVGFAAQNTHLMVAALGLGTTVVGAFEDVDLRRALELPAGVSPLVILPIGRPS